MKGAGKKIKNRENNENRDRNKDWNEEVKDENNSI